MGEGRQLADYMNINAEINVITHIDKWGDNVRSITCYEAITNSRAAENRNE